MIESQNFLTNNVCAYIKGKADAISKGKCTPSLSIRGNSPYIIDIQFKSLSWIGNAENTKFRLSFSDALNYN